MTWQRKPEETYCNFANFKYRDHTFFHALTFAGSRGSCLNMRPLGRMFKLLPRDPANVNALKQTRLIVILAFYMLSWKIPSKTPGKSWKSRFDCTVHIRWLHFVFRSLWRHSARNVMMLTSTKIKTKCLFRGSVAWLFDGYVNNLRSVLRIFN